MDSRMIRAALCGIVLSWLAGCSAGSAPVPADPAQRGAQLYGGNCVSCHQADGHGIPNVYPPLAGSAVANGAALPLVRWVVLGERPASLAPGRYVTHMPKYGWMGDADAAAVLSYVRTHFGNASGAVQPADVAHARGR